MFDEQKAEQIVEHISQGKTLATVLPKVGVARTTLHDWRVEHPHFGDKFARAKDAGYDAIAERIAATARGNTADGDSSGDVVRDRLIVETDLKLLAKWDPKRYGDRITQDVDLTVRVAIADPARQLRNAPATQQAGAQGAPALPALEHSGPVAALAVGALVQPNRKEDP